MRGFQVKMGGHTFESELKFQRITLHSTSQIQLQYPLKKGKRGIMERMCTYLIN